ncbi:hypothetical protein ACKRZS_008110 [Fusarium odoratissimum]
MGPELALAIEGCATESTALIFALIKKIHEVRRLKNKCEALGTQAQILLHLLKKNRAAITSFRTLGQFTACLNRIDAFVSAIKQSSFFGRALEAEILSREDHVSKQLGSVLKTQGEQKEILLYLQASAKLVEDDQLSSAPVVELHTEFKEKDFIFVSESQDGNPKRGTLNGVGQVVCYKIELTRAMPEFLKIYKNIQAGAYVQRLFGTVKLKENYYVVMQDLEDGKTLASACKDGGLPDTPLARVSLAYDVAKTMAWYHNAQLLLKSVSDDTIVLQELSSGRLTPFLTKLQNARHILEISTRLKYDVRYEAPEYEKLREHSKYTDIWSLGVIIWQCLTGLVPYKLSTAVGVKDKDYANLRKALDEGVPPGDLNASDFSSFRNARDLIEQCWNKNPWLRPTAASAADILLDIRVQLSISTPDTPEEDVAETEKAAEPKSEATADEEDKPGQPDDPSVAEEKKLDESDVKTPDPGEIEEVINAALAALTHARELNDKENDKEDDKEYEKKRDKKKDKKKAKKQEFHQSDQCLSKDHFQLLFDKDSDRSPVENFLIGAIIFWNLSDAVQEEVESAGVVALALSAEGMRAQTSIQYLQSAAEAGYAEAYLELFKAHAVLARELRDQVPKKDKTKTLVVGRSSASMKVPKPA